VVGELPGRRRQRHRGIRQLRLDAQFEPLKVLLQQYPDYTPAAILTTIALRQGGMLSTPRALL